MSSALGTELSLHTDREAWVEEFSLQVTTKTNSGPEYNDGDAGAQLEEDLARERERRSAQRRQRIKEIDAHFSKTRPNDLDLFRQSQNDLLGAMKAFQSLVPDHLRTQAIPTSWEDVETAVSAIQTQWETKNRESRAVRAKTWIRQMCNGLHNHSSALKMLPSENEYVSLVAGSVTMIIKASANYIDITESFAKGVIDVNDAVNLVQKVDTYETQAVQQLAMRVYSKIFEYLRKCMTWYTSKSRTRFRMAFNETIYSAFQDDLQQIKQLCMLLSQQIQLNMSADVRVSRLLQEENDSDMKYLLKLHELEARDSRIRESANIDLLQRSLKYHLESSKDEIKDCLQGMIEEYHERLRSEISGAAMFDLFSHQIELKAPIVAARGLLPGSASFSSSRSSSGRATPVSLTTRSNSPANVVRLAPLYRREDMKSAAQRLDKYCNFAHVFPYGEATGSLLAEANFVSKLEDFTTAMNSRILYAYSRYQAEESRLLFDSTAAYITFATARGIPVVSYFCELSPDAAPSGRTRESLELCAMLHTMIAQLLDFLPEDLEAPEPSFTREYLAGLDGTLRTWDAAMGLFEDLLAAVRVPVLVFVIHGFNLLEDDIRRSTTGKLDQIVSCLSGLVRSSNPERIVKILFTTSGLSKPLIAGIEEHETVSCSPNMPRDLGETRSPSRRSLA